MEGISGGEDFISKRKIDDFTTWTVWKKGGQITRCALITVSRDGRTMKSEHFDSEGRATGDYRVYDRQ